MITPAPARASTVERASALLLLAGALAFGAGCDCDDIACSALLRVAVRPAAGGSLTTFTATVTGLTRPLVATCPSRGYGLGYRCTSDGFELTALAEDDVARPLGLEIASPVGAYAGPLPASYRTSTERVLENACGECIDGTATVQLR